MSGATWMDSVRNRKMALGEVNAEANAADTK